MKVVTKQVSENKSVTIIKNPSKPLLDKVKRMLLEKERQREIDSQNIHLYFPSE